MGDRAECSWLLNARSALGHQGPLLFPMDNGVNWVSLLQRVT